MRTHWKSWLVFALLVGTTAYCVAEQITLTTTYPSPKGVYQELRTTGSAYFATGGGNVGIGTGGAAEKLEVYNNSTSSTFAYIHNNNVDVRVGANVGIGEVGTTNAVPFAIRTGSMERVRVTETGEVGIGTSSPNPRAKLHVVGQAYLDPNGNNTLPTPNPYTLTIDGMSGGVGRALMVRDAAGTEMVTVNAMSSTGTVGIGNYSGVPPPIGTLAVKGGSFGGFIDAEYFPRLAAAGGAGRLYNAGIYASSGTGMPDNYSAAIVGVHTMPDGPFAGFGGYFEGMNGIGVRGGTVAGIFAGPVVIGGDPALGTLGNLFVEGRIGINMPGNQAYRQLDVNGTIVARPRLTLVQTWVGATIDGQNAADPTWNLDNDGGIFRIFTEPRLVPPAPGQVWLTIDAGAGGRVDIPGLLAIGSPAFSPYRLDVNGDARISGTLTMGGAIIGDIAEQMDCADCEAGDVVVVDPENDRHVTRSTRPYDSTFAGVISEKPSLNIGGSRSETAKPLALAGQVKCKVTTENGPIKRGDLLVTSSKPGHAMRADPDQVTPGTLIGKALEPLAEGDGTIVVLIIGG